MSDVLYRTTLPLMMFGPYTRKTSKVVGTKADGKKIYKYGKERVVLKEGVDKGMFPSVNNLYVSGKGGSVTRSAMAKRHINLWRTLVQSDWMNLYEGPIKDKKLYLDCYFVMPDHKKRDTSNVLKMLPDALEGVLYENDYYLLPRVQDFIISEDGSSYLMIELRYASEDDRPEWAQLLET